MNPLPHLPRTPRLAAFVFALTMTVAMLSGIGVLAETAAAAPELAVSASPARA